MSGTLFGNGVNLDLADVQRQHIAFFLEADWADGTCLVTANQRRAMLKTHPECVEPPEAHHSR